MRRWVIGLSILLGISTIGAGTTLGKIYKQEVQTYEQSLEQPLVKEALNNVYINSDVPIRLETTKGIPYVEFYSKLTGITETEPEFTIDVRVEGDSSYIHIKESYYSDWNFLMDHQQFATIYLPAQDMNELSIDANGYGQYFNIDNNINELNMKVSNADIELDGNYKTIKLDKGTGRVSINSKAPSDVILKGRGQIELKGQYNVIDIENYSGDTRIESSNQAEVVVRSNGGDVKMVGTYKEIEVESEYGNVDISSKDICDIAIYSSGEMRMEGAFNKVDVKSNYGSVDLINTIQPQKISLFGRYNGINIILPQDISGFEVTSKKEYEGQEGVATDFEVKRGQANNLIEKVEYGDSKSKIILEGSNDEIYILRGMKQQ